LAAGGSDELGWEWRDLSLFARITPSKKRRTKERERMEVPLFSDAQQWANARKATLL
jgi:hypothetical protein